MFYISIVAYNFWAPWAKTKLNTSFKFKVVFIFYYTTYIPRSIFLFITIKKFFINRILFIWCFWSAFGPTMPPATGQALGICLAPVALGFWALMLLCSKLRYLVPFQMFFYLPFPSTVEICCLKTSFFWSFMCVVHIWHPQTLFNFKKNSSYVSLVTLEF